MVDHHGRLPCHHELAFGGHAHDRLVRRVHESSSLDYERFLGFDDGRPHGIGVTRKEKFDLEKAV